MIRKLFTSTPYVYLIKIIMLAVPLLLHLNVAYGQTFTIDLKGIVKCPTAKVGEKATLFGVTYEAVDNNNIHEKKNAGADLTKICTSLVTNMAGLFFNTCFNQPIGNWDVSNVTLMNNMFQYNRCFNQPISNWDVSKVTSMVGMFDATPYNHPLGDWNVSKVTNMRYMFYGTPFNQPIGNWDVSNVTNMDFMFYGTPFNHSIGDWNVSRVTNMDAMFMGSQFNQPINQWCVNNIKTEPTDFSKNSPLTSQNKPVWGTCIGLPTTSNLSTPTDNAVGTAFKPPFNWNPSTNATKYQLQVFEGVEKMVVDTTITSNSFIPSKSLKSKTLHNWRVRGINESRKLTGEWSSVWKFTTISIPIPALASPSNGSTEVSGPVQLVWTPTSNTTGYHLQVAPNDGFTTLFYENNSISNFLLTLPNFVSGNPAKLYWRVRSKIDSGEFGDWSEIWSFARAKLTSDDNTAEQPMAFELKPNYPNPFNPTTTISFSIPTTSAVRLEVFSILGQPVTVLVDKTMTRGTHSVSFDAGSLSSGVYLYKLTSGDQSQIRMMNLVK
jgi:surface protein